MVPSAQPKLYSFHAPKVDRISKCQAKTPYNFGVKVVIASTLCNLIVGTRTLHSNPYDDHTLIEQMEPATILMQDSKAKPTTAFVDLGYRSVNAQNPDVHSTSFFGARPSGSVRQLEGALLKLRQAINPMIGDGCTRCSVRRVTTSNGCCA